MTAPDLKPCPFCKDHHVSTHFDTEQGDKWGYACCGGCGARGPEVRTSYDRDDNAPWRAEAIAAWNTRAPLADALAVPPWQPIETAPSSNGSKAFLAYVRGHGSVVCHRIGNTIYSNSNPRREIPGATLWMPLDEINAAALRAIGERAE